MSNSSASLVGSGESFARVVEDVRRRAMTTLEVALVTGVKERQVLNWAAGTSKPQGENRDRLLDLYYLVEQLSDVYEPQGIEIWLHSRNRGLDGERPIDLLQQGKFREVIDAVERLTTGAM